MVMFEKEALLSEVHLLVFILRDLLQPSDLRFILLCKMCRHSFERIWVFLRTAHVPDPLVKSGAVFDSDDFMHDELGGWSPTLRDAEQLLLKPHRAGASQHHEGSGRQCFQDTKFKEHC